MLERLIVSRIEHRLIIATFCFVTLFLIVGWVALNEEGRMTAEQQAFKAHSIEQGAALYVENCGICHGYDGLGSSQGPALNNPQLFGHDFFPDITQQIDDLTHEKADLTKAQVDLNTRLVDPGINDAGKQAANARLAEITTRMYAIDDQVEELNLQRIQAIQAAIDKGYDPARFDRLRNVGWSMTLDSFILTAISAGRPVSSSYWPQAMPAFLSEKEYFFPALQEYQMEDITAYVMNWDKGKNWTLDDLFAVQQFAIEPINPEPIEEQIQAMIGGDRIPEAVSGNASFILGKMSDYTGDPKRGDKLYHMEVSTLLGYQLPCSACHQQTTDGTGPMTNGTYTRIINERLKDPKLAGYTAEQYIVESIVQPGNYLVPNFSDVMPRVFGQELSYQDMADLEAYIKTLQ